MMQCLHYVTVRVRLTFGGMCNLIVVTTQNATAILATPPLLPRWYSPPWYRIFHYHTWKYKMRCIPVTFAAFPAKGTSLHVLLKSKQLCSSVVCAASAICLLLHVTHMQTRVIFHTVWLKCKTFHFVHGSICQDVLLIRLIFHYDASFMKTSWPLQSSHFFK